MKPPGSFAFDIGLPTNIPTSSVPFDCTTLPPAIEYYQRLVKCVPEK